MYEFHKWQNHIGSDCGNKCLLSCRDVLCTHIGRSKLGTDVPIPFPCLFTDHIIPRSFQHILRPVSALLHYSINCMPDRNGLGMEESGK